MHFTRHARNQMRRLHISAEDVERVCRNPDVLDTDAEGRSRFIARIRGVRIRVVLAVDRSDLVVTVHERRAN